MFNSFLFFCFFFFWFVSVSWSSEGAHNIEKIGCDFIQRRLSNFKVTRQPDQTIAPDFLR